MEQKEIGIISEFGRPDDDNYSCKKLCITNYNGKEMIDIRVFFKAEGKLWGTKKGISITISELEAFEKLFILAKKEVMKNGCKT